MNDAAGHARAFGQPTDAAVDRAAGTFKLLADGTRIRIVLHLLEAEELSVNALAAAIGRPPSAVSQHLAKLRLAGLVSTRRAGTTVHYRMDDAHVRRLLEDALYHAAAS